MIHLDPHDTIAAVSSPPGNALRGVIRITGPEALAVARATLIPGSRFEPPPGHPSVLSGLLSIDGLRLPLPATLSLWPGPRTYTGQPLAEIHTVGAPPIVQGVLQCCLAHGARLAEPGEFTLRAFLNGKLDLTRAEAVLGVIDARTPEQLDAALRQLAGGLAGPINALRNRLLGVLAHVEAGLDFVDEADVDPIGRASLSAELAAAAAEVHRLAARLSDRDRPGGLPRVVLVGPPNAGKSRLFNALVGDTRAIVSPVAGTTRDYLIATWLIDGLAAELIDTAGIDDVARPIESQAQALRMAQAASADLLLICRPADAPNIDPIDTDRPALVVATKCDLAPSPALEGAIATSATTGAGLDALRRAVADVLRDLAGDGDPLAGTAARCGESLAHAGESLGMAALVLDIGDGDELVAFELRLALDELGKVVGAVVTDDILDLIFSRFCIGK